MKKLALLVFLAAPAFADTAPGPAPVVEAPKPLAAVDAAPPAPAPAPAMEHPEGIEKVGMGVIEGGWNFVYAAYGVALSGVAAYAASLFLRRKGKS